MAAQITSSGASDIASDALQVLTEQVFENLRVGTPALEDLAKAAQRYQQQMELLNSAASVFIDALTKVTVSATRARGGTSELGQAMQKVVARHKQLVADSETQARKMNDQFITPLHKRLKSDAKTFQKMEDDFKNMTKSFKSELKKAGQNTIKAQKSASKKRDDPDAHDAMDRALDSMLNRSRSFEAFNQRCLKAVMIEERRRYCYLMDNYASVFASSFPADAMSDMLALASSPEELPASSELVILQNSSEGVMLSESQPSMDMDDMAQGGKMLQPSSLTKEFSMRMKQSRSPNLDTHPPGAPPEGLGSFTPDHSQLNPRSQSFRTPLPPGAVPIDVVLAQARANMRGGAS